MKQQAMVRVDTWRKKYRAEYPGWDYQLWTDKEVNLHPATLHTPYTLHPTPYTQHPILQPLNHKGLGMVQGRVPRLGLPALDRQGGPSEPWNPRP